jgi:hypothetical protein
MNSTFETIKWIMGVLIVLTLVAFDYVLPAKIVQKYDANNNDQLMDDELYNISIAALVLTSLTVFFSFFYGYKIDIMAGMFLILLPAMSISKKLNNNVTNNQLNVIAVATIMVISTGIIKISIDKD